MIDLTAIPTSSGCYIYRGKDNEIIYIGKAKNLKKRVSSYFQKRDLDPKTQVLVKHIESAEYITTVNEVEALILENTLIKKHTPKYNIDLKDSKSYAFIHLSGDVFPRIGILRKTTARGKLYGPFVSAADRDEILFVVKKTFKLRSCKTLTKRACLRYHIGHCSAPCIGNISKEAYQKNVQKAESVLSGNSQELVSQLKTEMEEFSKKKEFELAKDLRNQIFALEYLNNLQHMDRKSDHNEDVINYIIRGGKIYIMVFNVVQETLVSREDFAFPYHQNFLEEFLVRYYSGHETPREIILPDASEIQEEEAYTGEEEEEKSKKENKTKAKETKSEDAKKKEAKETKENETKEKETKEKETKEKETKGTKETTSKYSETVSKNINEAAEVKEAGENYLVDNENISRSLIDFLSQRHGGFVKITIPKRGGKKELLEIAEKNIERTFFGDISKAEVLGKSLMLPKTPSVIECFDISHLSGTHTVASMVQFRDGKPDKSNYRRFKIKTVDGINDVASIAEVVSRRYARLLEENKELPDLILIDGGKGQLSSAAAELKKLQIQTPVISIAEREEEIYVPGISDPIPIKKDEKASLYLQEIRDEAHRFAITYNRLLREKSLKE